MQICVLQQEISFFPVSCLLEVGLGNMSRISIVWEPITSHLIMVRIEFNNILSICPLFRYVAIMMLT